MTKSMLEKLTDHFEKMKRLNNCDDDIWGHMIGFYRESGEDLIGSYKFPRGVFRIRTMNEDFIYWDYTPD